MLKVLIPLLLIIALQFVPMLSFQKIQPMVDSYAQIMTSSAEIASTEILDTLTGPHDQNSPDTSNTLERF